jgi:hypothetical protein
LNAKLSWPISGDMPFGAAKGASLLVGYYYFFFVLGDLAQLSLSFNLVENNCIFARLD